MNSIKHRIVHVHVSVVSLESEAFPCCPHIVLQLRGNAAEEQWFLTINKAVNCKTSACQCAAGCAQRRNSCLRHVFVVFPCLHGSPPLTGPKICSPAQLSWTDSEHSLQADTLNPAGLTTSLASVTLFGSLLDTERALYNKQNNHYNNRKVSAKDFAYFLH